MRQLNVKNSAVILSPSEKWEEAVQYVLSEIAWCQPLSSIQAAVDFANKRGIDAKATAYERREALQNALIRTGYHLDRKDRVDKLSNLIELRELSLSEECGRPCVRFRIAATLEGGQEHISDETLEWLDANGGITSIDRNLERRYEPLIGVSKALDAYATDVAAEVYDWLGSLLPELRKEAA